MKSHIGLEHIRSNSQGRITHAMPGSTEKTSPEEASDKASPPAVPTGLVAVVVHVERGALDELLHKGD